jgi:hypothetical protein
MSIAFLNRYGLLNETRAAPFLPALILFEDLVALQAEAPSTVAELG